MILEMAIGGPINYINNTYGHNSLALAPSASPHLKMAGGI
jgi:hypothetical protein